MTEIEIDRAEKTLAEFLEFAKAKPKNQSWFEEDDFELLRLHAEGYIAQLKCDHLKIVYGPSAFENT